ncbi:hypothetical protein DLAC_03602 [Tieghemostelium lacteum]|uniref:Uncharacterized protein n=1 Tax=Tieghemostelium lacteum TaxID=361077 RepID=A0A152A0D9_TIELA|nr:hypothetical protein DLAC_03602 [Tieghemostelium lacteum]|eukprot:KYQ99663.1 hypothetical protein DLAC_03602 [Tieghemostelium lacteum]
MYLINDYLVVKILNIILNNLFPFGVVGEYQFKRNINRFIGTISRVSKYWKNTFIKRLSLDNAIEIKRESNISVDTVISLLERGVKLQLNLHFFEKTKSTHEMIINRIANNENQQTLSMLIENDLSDFHNLSIPQRKIIISSTLINNTGFVNVENFLTIDSLEIRGENDMALQDNHLPTLLKFKFLKHIKIYNVSCKLEFIIHWVTVVNPKSLKLMQSPYITSNNNTPRFDSLLDAISAKCTEITELQIIHYSMLATRKCFEKLFEHASLEKLFISGLVSLDEEPSIAPQINNQKLIWVGFGSIIDKNYYLRCWACQSRIQKLSFTYFDMNILKNHIAYLKSLDLGPLSVGSDLYEVISHNQSIEHLSIASIDRQDVNAFFEALNRNKTLTSLAFGAEYRDKNNMYQRLDDCVIKLFQLQHPTIQKLKLTRLSKTIDYFQEAIQKNHTITNLEMSSSQCDFETSIQTLVNIIEFNNSISTLKLAPFEFEPINEQQLSNFTKALQSNSSLSSLRILLNCRDQPSEKAIQSSLTFTKYLSDLFTNKLINLQIEPSYGF